jgi:hypothetical protein
METNINNSEMMIIKFSLIFRIEFLVFQIDNSRFSPTMLKYYEDELNNIKDLQKKLNFI